MLFVAVIKLKEYELYYSIIEDAEDHESNSLRFLDNITMSWLSPHGQDSKNTDITLSRCH